ncbi:hypothetical protein DFR72_101625 [Lentzea flaviverrucosa]|uniref:Uncharacterized protein n=1 Tax=Lentzea flaviverrucosa TaxID=200379 RepID=A0A1H9GKU1_9PSEU|nr:hypothetical protein DFR72_101625 [Lentzea flaviverrucosa]SEQ50715.1 hypothetical protein SAMN05216195_102592 [Lentzea flaviverrucosa]
MPVSGRAEVRDRLPGHAFDVASGGRVWFDAGADVLETTHQTWVRDPAAGDWRCDVFREPHDGGRARNGFGRCGSGWTACTRATPGSAPSSGHQPRCRDQTSPPTRW